MNRYNQELAAALGGHVVDADTLIATPHPDRLFIDLRLGEPDEEIDSFRKSHIFGAVYGQIRDSFAAPPTPESGNLPLPAIDALQRVLDDWQVGAETEIVVYGPSPALAARGWWVLTWAGVPNVRLLDGGLAAWTKSGGAVAQGDAAPRTRRSAPVRLSPDNLPSIVVADVAALDANTILIDARDEGAYLSGCIPNARNLPAADQWTPSRTFRSPREIRELYESVGVTPDSDVVVYCGGGVLSAMNFMTLAAVGARPRLYVGSWSEWCKCADRVASSARYLQGLAEQEFTQAGAAR